MTITVKATPSIREGPKLKGSKKPFGRTLFGGVAITKITLVCMDQFHRRADPCSEEHGKCWCVCKIREIELSIRCVIQYNPKKIDRGYFDPDTHDAYTADKKRKEGDIKLDKKSVEVHEKSHCEDITEAIRKYIKEILEKNENDYVCERQCRQKDRCENAIRRMIQNRIKAVGKKTWSDLTKKASTHYRESDTEKKARKKQAEDFKKRKKGKKNSH